jgi:NDP-sugar pyrophosphorylase family protein
MQCVILAGGLATRMRPLTDRIPKALIPAGGKPFVDHQLGWLAGHGVTDVVMCIGYRGDAIRAYVYGNEGDADRRRGLRVRFVDEGDDLRCTAGALRLALDEGVLEESFLVTYGDSFLPIDFGDVFRAHADSGKPALMTVFRNDGRWDTSNVIFDGRMVTLYDKQRRTRPASDFSFIDYGLSALSRQVIAAEIPAGAGPVTDLGALFHRLSLRGALAGLEVAQRFYEIGSPAGLADFEQWLRRDP